VGALLTFFPFLRAARECYRTIKYGCRTGIPLVEFACLVISVVMLRGNVFSKATAYAGILGNVLLMVVEFTLSVRGLTDAGMAIAIGAGLSMMTWYFLVGRRLFQLGYGKPDGARTKSG